MDNSNINNNTIIKQKISTSKNGDNDKPNEQSNQQSKVKIKISDINQQNQIKPQPNSIMPLQNQTQNNHKQPIISTHSQQQQNSPQLTEIDSKQSKIIAKENKDEKESKKKQKPIQEIPQTNEKDNLINFEQLKIRSPPIIINELPRKQLIESISQKTIKYIFKREEYSIKIFLMKTINHLRHKISAKVNLPIEELELYYQNKLIDSSMDNIQLSHFLKRKPYSYFEIRKKCNNSLLSSINEIYNSQGYEHKVIILDYPSTLDLSNHITTFFRETMQIKDIKVESIRSNNAVLCFRSSALAFDFNRYLWFIKAQDPKWNQMKSSIQLPQIIKKIVKSTPLQSPRSNNSSKTERMLPTVLYNSLQSSPYLSLEDRRMKEYKESKKKWVSSKDFITSVGNYSMVQYKKYHPLI